MAKASTLQKIDDLIGGYPALVVCKDDLTAAVEAICDSYRGGHKLIACGNGGSAADAEHIVGELMKGFLLPRKLDKKMEERFRQVCRRHPSHGQRGCTFREQGLWPASLRKGRKIAGRYPSQRGRHPHHHLREGPRKRQLRLQTRCCRYL